MKTNKTLLCLFINIEISFMNLLAMLIMNVYAYHLHQICCFFVCQEQILAKSIILYQVS